MKKKLNYELTPKEWNKKIDELNKYGVEYHITKLACAATLSTRSAYYHVSLIKDPRATYNVGAIISSFRSKTHYHEIQNQYGYKIDEKSNKVKWDYGVAHGYSYSDSDYARKWLKCWSYDINSAFAYAMMQPMPDTTKEPRYEDDVREGEIGFYSLGGATTNVGEPADIIFPLMESPFRSYVEYYYNLKKNAKDKAEKAKWKDFLNIATGHLAKTNIFLRNAILYYSNRYIKSFIDDDTVYCNVDCIVSLKPRNDLPIGNELGQFKIEHENDNFKYIKAMQYQWNKECHYNGIPSESLTDIENIDNWQDYLFYTFNGDKIVKNKKYGVEHEEKKNK